jgi:cobalt-zinc-cadmium efflux system outer membrane protein
LSFGVARDAPHESALFDQPFEIAGQRGKRIAVAREEQKATEIDIGIVGRNIRRRTREAFYRVLWARAQAEQAKAARELAARTRDVVQQRFEAGDVAQLEAIQADIEAVRAEVDHEAAEQTRRSADAQLSGLLNRPLDQPLTLAGDLGAAPAVDALEIVTAQALTSNADIQRSNQDLRVEERRLTLVKAQRVPNVDIQAGVDLNSPPDFEVGPRGQIAVQLPIFYHGQGEVAQSSARLELLRLTLEAQRTSASANVAAAYFDYLAKARQAQQYKERILPEAQKLAEMSEDSYRSGKSNLLGLIDAQRKLNEVRRAYLDSVFAAQSSFANLEEVVGAPLD